MRRRRLLWAAAAGGVAVVGIIAGVFYFNPTPKAQAGAANVEIGGPQLPVSQVVLFNSGVGYFQREGEVEGNARVDLSFREEDINDLLKSMVLQDLGGGHVSAVSYDSHDPIDRTLESFAINFNGNPTFSQILNQARGEKVEVVLQQSVTTQPGTITGTIVGVEKQKQAAGTTAIDAEVLNLWCAEGMRSVKLGEVQRLRFLNPVMENEVRRALDTLSLSHDVQKKAVSLNFLGEGKRPIRVGYVVENPIWKTSYRLVMGKEGKPFLQGWAIVENPTDEDWNAVRMALISGRPISFRMDLYDPLYIQRPLVEPELFASLRPPTYTGAMDKFRKSTEAGEARADGKPGYLQQRGNQLRDRAMAEQLARTAAAPAPGFGGGQGAWAKKQLDADLNLASGVASAATASELGDYFQYAIDHPVTLPRQKSALLPIVNQNVDGTRVSIFNQSTHPKHPLLGLKFKNTSGLHLTQGPITVFEGSNYAGDARILDLQPNEERLLSYAIDLGTEVEAVNPSGTDRITRVSVNRGIIQATHLIQETKNYNAKNRSDTERLLIIEHPYRPQFTLVSDVKPAERARDVYRFEVPVPADKNASLTVTEERTQAQQIRLDNTDSQQITLFLNSNSKVISDSVKSAITKTLELKNALALTQRELQQVNRQLNDLVQDQARLRANLKEMPPTAAAYKRYLQKFDDQETEIEKLRDKIKEYQDQEHQQRLALDKFLANLTVE